MPAQRLDEQVLVDTLAVWEKHGRNQQLAADEVGIPRPTFQKRLAAARARLSESAVKGNAEEYGYRDRQPDPFVIKGTSTLFGRDPDTGERIEKLQWVKTKLDDEQRALLIREAFEDMAERVPSYSPVEPPLIKPDPHLCNLITLTDCHVGMLAWGKEGGADWDLQIAKRVLVQTFANMLDRMPAAAVCVVNQLGDFLHYDSMRSETPEHKNMLDADGRPQKMIGAAIDILDEIVQHALRKHDRVHLVMAEGNHDMVSSIWLRMMFRKLYANEPRVTVDDTPLPYYVFQHGKVMLAFHHGHLAKPDKVTRVIPAQFPKMWGATEYRYGHSGHQHHKSEKEDFGITWTQHRTLAARDAFAARGGWIAERSATGLTYHDQYGEWGSITLPAAYIEEREAPIL